MEDNSFLVIETKSLCPVCYKTIPAVISINDNVWMDKYCNEHGEFTAMVERDPLWFGYCINNRSKDFYSGYMIDVINRCNLSCKYCYHKNDEQEKSINDILSDVKSVSTKGPIILSGGEPTLHRNLPEIVLELSKTYSVILLTNGIELCDSKYLNKLINCGLAKTTVPGLLNIGLSIHSESNKKDLEFLELCREYRYKIGTALYVIDDLNQISNCIDMYKSYSDVLTGIRIKAATKIWNEHKNLGKIFTSDMIKCLESMGATDLITNGVNNKTSFCGVVHEGLPVALISWYDINNVDLNDINCAPYYRAKDGKVYHMLTAFLVNEGLDSNECMSDCA